MFGCPRVFASLDASQLIKADCQMGAHMSGHLATGLPTKMAGYIASHICRTTPAGGGGGVGAGIFW